jgi:hypothetical protein
MIITINDPPKEGAAMDTKILLAAIAIVVAFGIAVIGPVSVPPPVVARTLLVTL